MTPGNLPVRLRTGVANLLPSKEMKSDEGE
jgi:hypothetical protein